MGVDLEVARTIAELPGMAVMVLSEAERASLFAPRLRTDRAFSYASGPSKRQS